jgi:predicted phage baseplate assembly protein
MLTACELGGGERGNVKPRLISEWVNERQRALGIAVDNPDYAAGGAEAETLQETLQRAQAELQHTFRAVTNEDYETIARETPGAAVSRVHAIPLFKPGLADYPRDKADGQVSVVVVPYSLSETPTPSKGFLQTVKRHLDTRRLVTTEVHVIPPVYIKVTVNAVVVVEPQFVDEGQRLIELLKRLLRPLDGEHGAKGWTFGRSVYKGDIYNALSGGSGVVYVQDLWLDAEGPHVRKSAGGDVILPPHGLVYSGQHDIQLISRTHL